MTDHLTPDAAHKFGQSAPVLSRRMAASRANARILAGLASARARSARIRAIIRNRNIDKLTFQRVAALARAVERAQQLVDIYEIAARAIRFSPAAHGKAAA